MAHLHRIPKPPPHGLKAMRMFHILHQTSLRRLLGNDLPTMLVAGVIAEFFYKWRSFTLEALGFLATWYALGAIVHVCVERRMRSGVEGDRPGA